MPKQMLLAGRACLSFEDYFFCKKGASTFRYQKTLAILFRWNSKRKQWVYSKTKKYHFWMQAALSAIQTSELFKNAFTKNTLHHHRLLLIWCQTLWGCRMQSFRDRNAPDSKWYFVASATISGWWFQNWDDYSQYMEKSASHVPFVTTNQICFVRRWWRTGPTDRAKPLLWLSLPCLQDRNDNGSHQSPAETRNLGFWRGKPTVQ